MKQTLINRICLLGCVGAALLAGAPNLHASVAPANITFDWVPDTLDTGYSGSITVFGLPIDSGIAALLADGGKIASYDIHTPIGEFTDGNSTIESVGTVAQIEYPIAWDETTITDLQLEINKGSAHLFGTETSLQANFDDPDGHWVKAGVPDVTSTALLFAFGLGALALSRRAFAPQVAVARIK